MGASEDCALVRHVDGDQVILHEPIRRAFVTLQLDAEPDEGLLLTLLSRPGVEVTFTPGRGADMMAVVQSATVVNYCSTTGRGVGELSLLVPIETCADLAGFQEIGRRCGDPSLLVGVELADVLAERDTLRRLVGRLAQRIQFARLGDPNPGGEDPLLREAAAACKRAREEERT